MCMPAIFFFHVCFCCCFCCSVTVTAVTFTRMPRTRTRTDCSNFLDPLHCGVAVASSHSSLW